MTINSTGTLLLQQAYPGVQLTLWLPNIRNQHPRPTLVHLQANLGVTPAYYRMIWSVAGIVCSPIREYSHAFAVLLVPINECCW
jgi:hypothetical protein